MCHENVTEELGTMYNEIEVCIEGRREREMGSTQKETVVEGRKGGKIKREALKKKKKERRV